MMKRLAVAVIVLFACGARPAVAAQCSVSFTTLNFGTYSGALLNGVASGSVNCNNSWDLPLDKGRGVGATLTLRTMTGPGGAQLDYQLFLDSARTINWGNTTNNELSGNGDTNFYVYGRISAGQTAVPGTYTDTISSSSSSFTVIAVIQASCAITASAMNFGTYTAAVIHTTSTLTITCTNTTPYNVGLNAGTGSGATVSNRKMTSPANATLNYSIFRNSAWTQNWGNTVGSDTLPGTGNGVAQTITAYGQMAAGQFGNPAVYKDTITATITY